ALVQLACGDIFINNLGHMKAFNTCITHLIVMSVTLTLAMTAFLSYRTQNTFSPDSHVFVSTMYILFPSCFNPIIYGVRTKEIRLTFLKFINNFVVVLVIRNGLLTITMVSLAGKLSYCVTNIIDHCFCEHMALVQLACGDISINNLVGLLTAFLIPTADCILIIVSYVVIFVSVFRSGKAQMKAINTCITHLIVLTCSLIFALTAFMSYRTKNNFSSSSRVFVSTMYICFPSCFNPIIYGLRTKEIRQKLLQFLNNIKVLPL
ncbi:putative olfactory receptor 52N5-like, partial [Triplophysa rosa]